MNKDIYPDFSLSSCGKNYYDYIIIKDYMKIIVNKRDILINQDNSGKLVAMGKAY